jgi:hypothetical protein
LDHPPPSPNHHTTITSKSAHSCNKHLSSAFSPKKTPQKEKKKKIQKNQKNQKKSRKNQGKIKQNKNMK